MIPTNENVAEAFVATAREELAKAATVIQHCLEQLTDERIEWVLTADISDDFFERYSALGIAPLLMTCDKPTNRRA